MSGQDCGKYLYERWPPKPLSLGNAVAITSQSSISRRALAPVWMAQTGASSLLKKGGRAPAEPCA